MVAGKAARIGPVQPFDFDGASAQSVSGRATLPPRPVEFETQANGKVGLEIVEGRRPGIRGSGETQQGQGGGAGDHGGLQSRSAEADNAAFDRSSPEAQPI